MPPLETEADSITGDALASAVWTLRGWLPMLVLFCVGGLGAGVARNYLFSKSSGVATEQAGIIESIAKPSLAPEEVVRQQVDSMRASTTAPSELVTCFSLASPSNRELTGPYERFAKLVSTEPYRQIGVCREYQIGQAVVEGNGASVVVSVLSEFGSGLAFQFLLTKQSYPPYRDCWMADGVFPLLPLPKSGPDTAPHFKVLPNSIESIEQLSDPNQPADDEAYKL